MQGIKIAQLLLAKIIKPKEEKKMKKTSLVLAMVLTMLVLFVLAGVSSYACTLGVTDCRRSSPGSTTCYTWECETCGSETCWIYKGTECTCPQAKNENDLYDHDQNQIVQCSGDNYSDQLPQADGSH